MALANVAFLSAMNGLRVLVMDWDLEAPGLHHYFRGIIEADEMSRLREAEGVLDIAWQWRASIENAGDKQAVDDVFEHFRTGEPFRSRCLSVMGNHDDEDAGCLDIIPAGAREVKTPAPVEYERALASFSWADFLDRYTGGGMLDALRTWASSNYDLVLIDSRTGLADVAGICTVQLPDAVILAFVLNRANIEGVARVAGAIRQFRGNEVRIWPVPMRISREGTAEEADARARAAREFVRVGGLDREQVERDMRGLLIKAEPNVPFMESLAPFNDTDAALDPLTANMARLAREITGVDIETPEISDSWRDSVQSRLAPALSTEVYLRQLMTAEPVRAAREMHRYVESALTTLLSDEESLSPEYVRALAETSFAMQQRGNEALELEGYDTADRLIILLRRLHERDPGSWRDLLIEALQNSLDVGSRAYAIEDEIVALEEIDGLLAADEPSVAIHTRRGETRLRIARLYQSLEEWAPQLASAEDALAQFAAARKLPEGQGEDLQVLRLEALLQKSAALEDGDQLEEAIDTLRKVVKAAEPMADQGGRPDAMRLAFESNYRLMRLVSIGGARSEEVARYARAAVKRAQPSSPTFLSRVAELTDAIIATPGREAAVDLLRHVVTPRSATPAAAQFFSRALRAAAHFVDALRRLTPLSFEQASGEEARALLEMSVQIVEAILATGERRALGQPISGGPRLFSSSLSLSTVLTDAVIRYVDEAFGFAEGDVATRLSSLRASATELAARTEVLLAQQSARRRPRPKS
jgi:tetratricopeptide (TPR) repeat protein